MRGERGKEIDKEGGREGGKKAGGEAARESDMDPLFFPIYTSLSLLPFHESAISLSLLDLVKQTIERMRSCRAN